MDVLSDVLRSIHLSGSMLFLVDAVAPWVSWAPRAEVFRPAVLPASQHLVSYHIIIRGQCWAGLRDAPPERFAEGDILVVPHGDAYFLANPPDAEITYGTDEAVSFFRRMAAGELPTVVAQCGSGSEPTQFICGFLGCQMRPFNPVLAALPPMIHLRATTPQNQRMRHLVDFALCELREPSPGGRGVLLRLAELMFIEVVRACVEDVDDSRSGWLAGLRDPLIARALHLLHQAPARRWTLESLAEQAGASRSVLAEHFGRIVGQPPMHYLMEWRMQLASRLLAEPGSKVVAVAAAVGYDSESAFSRAFKKLVGVSPARWRQRGEA